MRQFPLGRILATPRSLELLKQYDLNIHTYLNRHQKGDWGDIPIEDKRTNREALVYGNRLLSAYILNPDDPSNSRLWIITEADRSVTTLLLPEEY